MQRLYVGGPVASNTILSLSNQSVDGSVDIVDGVYCGGLKDACTKVWHAALHSSSSSSSLSLSLSLSLFLIDLVKSALN